MPASIPLSFDMPATSSFFMTEMNSISRPLRVTHVRYQQLVQSPEMMQDVVNLVNDTFQSLNSNLFNDPREKRLHNDKELIDEVGVSGMVILIHSSTSPPTLLALAIVKPYASTPGLPRLPPPRLPSPHTAAYSSLFITRVAHGYPGLFRTLHEAIDSYVRQQGWNRIACVIGEGDRLVGALKRLGYEEVETKTLPVGYLGMKYESIWSWLVKRLPQHCPNGVGPPARL